MPNFMYSTVGKKIVMSLTGAMLLSFVLIHMLGNLQLYAGPTKLNAYAAFLKSAPMLLWGARLMLLCVVSLHVLIGITLAYRNFRSRPIAYTKYRSHPYAWVSRNVLWAGLLIAGFVAYHLLHFTLGVVHPSFDSDNVYQNVILGFSYWPASLCYGIAMIGLGLHVYHGAWSMFQSVGIDAPRQGLWRRYFATAVTILILAGNLSFPIAVLFGFVQ